jgi:hypothetical protein
MLDATDLAQIKHVPLDDTVVREQPSFFTCRCLYQGYSTDRIFRYFMIKVVLGKGLEPLSLSAQDP